MNGSGQVETSKDTFDQIVAEFRKKLGLTLFGIDVIVERGSGRHAIIDMNVFPGLLFCLLVVMRIDPNVNSP